MADCWEESNSRPAASFRPLGSLAALLPVSWDGLPFCLLAVMLSPGWTGSTAGGGSGGVGRLRGAGGGGVRTSVMGEAVGLEGRGSDFVVCF